MVGDIIDLLCSTVFLVTALNEYSSLTVLETVFVGCSGFALVDSILNVVKELGEVFRIAKEVLLILVVEVTSVLVV